MILYCLHTGWALYPKAGEAPALGLNGTCETRAGRSLPRHGRDNCVVRYQYLWEPNTVGRFGIAFQEDENAKLSILQDLLGLPSPEAAGWIAARTPIIRFKSGQTVGTPGQLSRACYLLVEGRVRTYTIVQGAEHTFQVLSPGAMFNENALVDRPHDVYAEALENSKVATLSSALLKRFVEENPITALRITELFIRRALHYEAVMADVALKEIPARLAGLILRLVESEGECEGGGGATPNRYVIPTRYSHELLGTMIGAKRVAVTRAFRQLREEGAVELRRRFIHVKDLQILKRLAQAG